MEIGPLSNRQPGKEPTGEGNRRARATQLPAHPTPNKGDRVEISLEARARLAELADRELAQERTEPQAVGSGDETRQDRLELIRERIASGYYNDPQVRSKMVDRLIDDLDN